MTRATKKPRATRASCTVVVLDAAWRRGAAGSRSGWCARPRAPPSSGARRGGRKSLTVALADDKRVRALNARDRRKDKPTNVLSYPSGERAFLGDVVLARQTVWREAKGAAEDAGRSCRPISWCTARLHLLGYDHETGNADAERMEALERRILKRLGIADPYDPLARASASDCLPLGGGKAGRARPALRRKFDIERAKIFLHPFARRRLRNGDHAGLGQQPGERELRRRAAHLVGELLQRGLAETGRPGRAASRPSAGSRACAARGSRSNSGPRRDRQ